MTLATVGVSLPPPSNPSIHRRRRRSPPLLPRPLPSVSPPLGFSSIVAQTKQNALLSSSSAFPKFGSPKSPAYYVPTYSSLPTLRGAGPSNKFVAFAGRHNGNSTYDDDFQDDPFLLSLIKEASRALKVLFVFLVEQPGQLKYIEWPSFNNTLKTATLTLVLVAFLIIALSTMDSALAYLLATFLRRAP